MWVCVSTGGDVPHTPSRQQTAPGTPVWPSVQEVLLQRDTAPNCPQPEHPEGGDTAVPRAGRAHPRGVWPGGRSTRSHTLLALQASGQGGMRFGQEVPKITAQLLQSFLLGSQAGRGLAPTPPLHSAQQDRGAQHCPEVPRNKAREGARPPASCPGVPTRSLPHPCPARGRGSGGRRRAAHTRLCVLAGFTSRGRSRRGVGRAPGRPRPRSCARSAASRIPGAARQAPVCVGAGQVRGHRRSWPPWGS